MNVIYQIACGLTTERNFPSQEQFLAELDTDNDRALDMLMERCRLPVPRPHDYYQTWAFQRYKYEWEVFRQICSGLHAMDVCGRLQKALFEYYPFAQWNAVLDAADALTISKVYR